MSSAGHAGEQESLEPQGSAAAYKHSREGGRGRVWGWIWVSHMQGEALTGPTGLGHWFAFVLILLWVMPGIRPRSHACK